MISASLIIQEFVFFDKLNRECVSFMELLTNDATLMDKPDALDEFAVISPLSVR
jgi:hypothetical protein